MWKRPFHSLRRLVRTVVAARVAGWSLMLTSSAFAQPAPSDGPPFGPPPQVPPTVPARVVEIGSPVWQFVMVAAAAAALAILVEYLVARRRPVPRSAANAA
jgi:hypothetical protein